MHWHGRIAALCLVLGQLPAMGAQEESGGGDGRQERPSEVLRLQLRVTSSGPGPTVVVDRGRRDRVEEGDLVVLRPRDGTTLRGRVLQLTERSAIVELVDPVDPPPRGTRGVVRIPAERLRDRIEEAQPEEPAPATEAGEGAAAATGGEAEEPPAKARWDNQDPDWKEGMPLLSAMRSVRPEDRPFDVAGRVYLSTDQTWTTESGRSDYFQRLGTNVDFRNAFGVGGVVSFDGELNDRRAQVPDADDEDTSDFRLDRLSYVHGGTRFQTRRWEAGRFLQYGMPEFGVLDGLEWGQRRRNGDRWGASLGYMPEPDRRLESGQDFQVAAYYEHAVGGSEDFTVGGGLQKTLHNGTSDRDLFVGKMRYLPAEGWDFSATTWVDFYDSRDVLKGSGPELTQAYVSTGRRWSSGNGVDVSWSHLRFPEIERNEFVLPSAQEIANDRRDRLAVRGWRWMGEKKRFHGQIAGWDDEDDEGGDVTLGVDVRDLFGRGSRSGLTGFATAGQHSSVVGARVSFGKYTEDARWQVFYELANHHQMGFSADLDDIVQHRFGGSHEIPLLFGWSIALFADANLWDSEGSWSIGAYLQRNF